MWNYMSSTGPIGNSELSIVLLRVIPSLGKVARLYILKSTDYLSSTRTTPGEDQNLGQSSSNKQKVIPGQHLSCEASVTTLSSI